MGHLEGSWVRLGQFSMETITTKHQMPNCYLVDTGGEGFALMIFFKRVIFGPSSEMIWWLSNLSIVSDWWSLESGFSAIPDVKIEDANLMLMMTQLLMSAFLSNCFVDKGIVYPALVGWSEALIRVVKVIMKGSGHELMRTGAIDSTAAPYTWKNVDSGFLSCTSHKGFCCDE
ncbi:hypothetical protein Tco_1182808 [Tanacetum coccineum]